MKTESASQFSRDAARFSGQHLTLQSCIDMQALAITSEVMVCSPALCYRRFVCRPHNLSVVFSANGASAAA